VTHAHPDHFNGVLGLVREQEVPVYATAGVSRVIKEIAVAKRAQWSPVYGAEWPAETYYPNTPLADGATVQLGELSFTVREVPPGRAADLDDRTGRRCRGRRASRRRLKGR
jgi:glyoxylase-like metal-dependent hydrolase (beta-lactamase superfamily II)